jgi:hypothetical protein
MRLSTMVMVTAVSLLAIASAVATARMYTYSPVNRELTQGMQQEMNGVISIQQEYQSGHITQQQYQHALQHHLDDMQELRSKYGASHPMMGW